MFLSNQTENTQFVKVNTGKCLDMWDRGSEVYGDQETEAYDLRIKTTRLELAVSFRGQPPLLTGFSHSARTGNGGAARQTFASINEFSVVP